MSHLVVNTRVVLMSAMMEYGVQYATKAGATLMLQWCAINWDSLVKVLIDKYSNKSK